MPELPEVETIRRGLEPHLVGRRITGVQVRETRLRTPLDASHLAAHLGGRRLVGVERRSKYLLFHLEDAHVLVIHLGMTGRLRLDPAGAPLPRHTHVVVEFEDGRELRFEDARRFGMLFVVEARELGQHPRFEGLGPEPLSPDFDLAYVRRRAQGVRKPIKNFLMDASVVVGVGNIYATEALYEARVHPRTAAARLSVERLARLRRAVRQVLRRALRAGGTTLRDYRDATGEAGTFQVRLRAYGRDGETCGRCGRTIRRLVQSGRSTFYCPGCQH